MAIFNLRLSGRKSEIEPDPEHEVAARVRVADRIEIVQKARHPRGFGTIRGADRQYEREQTYRVATAMFAPDNLTSCRIVDQSHSGLRLSFNSDVECPDDFALTIPTLRFIGIVRKVWQTGRDAGVSIVRWTDCA
jgi:hypothetical protein